MARSAMSTTLGLMPVLMTAALTTAAWGQSAPSRDGREVSVAGSSVKTPGVGNASLPNLMKNGEGNGQAPAIETDKNGNKSRETTSQ